jgi:hypothetical protein
MTTETQTQNFSKVVRIGTARTYNNRVYSIFCKIEFKDGRLSISGVEGPTRDGNAIGGCGQIDNHLRDELHTITPAPGWDALKLRQFFNVWERWHLNDLRAGSPAQEKYLRENPIPKEDYAYPKSHYEVASKVLADAGLNPDADGYRYGYAWKREEIPADVIDFLQSLPDTDKQPAWV